MKIKIVREVDVSGSYRTRQLESIFDVPAKKKSRLEWRGDFPFEDRPWNVGLIVGPSGCGKTTIAKEIFTTAPENGIHGSNRAKLGDPRKAQSTQSREKREKKKALGKSKSKKRNPDSALCPLCLCGETNPEWKGKSVIDDFDKRFSIRDIAKVCSAVGFNTIPAWLRPYRVLSTGEKFRVELARTLLEGGELVVVDEFTSVVDRQVAKIGSHAVQKYVRKTGRKFVAVSCHYDIIDWLQPDWIFEPATMTFTRRSVRRRPEIECIVQRVPRTAWSSFAPYHYLTAGLPRGAVCYGLFTRVKSQKSKVEGLGVQNSGVLDSETFDFRPSTLNSYLVGFCGVIFRPGKRVGQKTYGVSRVVILPDWQGMGLAFVLMDFLGSCHKALGRRFHNYPTHPGFVYAHNRSPNWSVRKHAGVRFDSGRVQGDKRRMGAGRHNAVFRYTGPAAEIEVAEKIVKTKIKF